MASLAAAQRSRDPARAARPGEAALIRRLALVIDDGRVTTVFHPVFPPDRNAPDVVEWLRGHPRRG